MSIPTYENYNGAIRPTKAPNLLIAPVEYSQRHQDQVNNALRLYFNQIDNFSFFHDKKSVIRAGIKLNKTSRFTNSGFFLKNDGFQIIFQIILLFVIISEQ